MSPESKWKVIHRSARRQESQYQDGVAFEGNEDEARAFYDVLLARIPSGYVALVDPAGRTIISAWAPKGIRPFRGRAKHANA